MSLFENSEYQWRETFFVMFSAKNRPTAANIEAELSDLGTRLEIKELRANDEGLLESVTIVAQDDFAAMDISCVVGDEVSEQVPDLLDELRRNGQAADEKEKLSELKTADVRLDVFHFEKQTFEFTEEMEDDGLMDPGGLLIVLEHLANLCRGVVIDPQAGSVL